MTTVSTLQTNSNTYTYDEFVQLVQSGAVDTSDLDSVSVFEASTDSSECTDGEDDGKIGIGSALLNIGKGIVSGAVNMVKGAFTDEDGNFSIGQTLKTAAVTALCFTPVVGQFVAAGLCAYGCVTGAVGVANGIYSAATADTDAEAKEAFQSIGTSGLTLGLSAYGASKVGSSLKSQYGNGVSSEASLTKNISTVGKNIGKSFSDYYGSSWSSGTSASYAKSGTTAENATLWQKVKAGASGTKSVLNEAASGTVNNIANTAEAVKDEVSEKYNKATAKTGESLDALSKTEGTTVETSADGNTKTVTTESNGTKTTKTYELNSDGKYQLSNKSTTSTTSVTDKNTGNTTETIKNSDGSSVKTTTDKSGNVVEKTTTKADGSSVKTTTDSLGNTTEVRTAADGSTQTTVRDSYGHEQSSYSTTSSGGSTTTTTDFNPIDLAKEYNLTTDQVATLQDGGTVTTKNGTTLTTTAADDYKSVTIKTKASTVGKATSAVSDWFSNATSADYSYTSTGTVLDATETATGAVALSTVPELLAGETIDSMEDISNASTTYVTTSGTTGVEYTLQDYSLPTSEEIDKTYAEIYGSIL